MSDFLDRLERQLVQRARETAAAGAPSRRRRSRRTLVFALIGAAMLAGVPAAAVTGVFSNSADHHLPAGPGLVDVNPCTQKSPPHGKTTTQAPPSSITQNFAIFRRRQLASDRLPDAKLGLFTADGVNPAYVRRVTSSNGFHAYLIPAENVAYRPPLGGKGCNETPQPRLEPQAGICIRMTLGGSCGPVAGILAGKSLFTEGGSTHGKTFAAGVVRDGVDVVIWRVRRGGGFLDTRIRVRDNVFIGRFPSRQGHGLYVYFVDAQGKHLVIGPHRFTPAERARLRRAAKLDREAGPTPAVDPAVGGTKTLFELRMRVKDVSRRYVYVVTVTGRRPGDCKAPYRYRIGMVPGTKRAERGLMRAAFGPYPGAPWCRGTYHGTVRRQLGYSRDTRGPVVGRFEFTVR